MRDGDGEGGTGITPPPRPRLKNARAIFAEEFPTEEWPGSENPGKWTQLEADYRAQYRLDRARWRAWWRTPPHLRRSYTPPVPRVRDAIAFGSNRPSRENTKFARPRWCCPQWWATVDENVRAKVARCASPLEYVINDMRIPAGSSLGTFDTDLHARMRAMHHIVVPGWQGVQMQPQGVSRIVQWTG